MKKKIILLAMMLLTLIGGVNLNVLNAQEDVVTINGDATSYNHNYPIPFNSSYGLCQVTYTGTEINHASGFISNIALKIDVDRERSDIAFYLQNTTETTLSTWIPFSDSDRVFYSNSFSTSEREDGWLSITLDNSFEYTGGNILLTVWDNSGSATYTYNNGCAYKGNSGRNSMLYKYDSNPVSTSSACSPSTRQPAIKFFFAEPEDDLIPAVPTNLQATAIDHQSVSLTWDAAENAKKYNVYQGGVNIGTVSGTSYAVTGLTPETTYSFTVTGVRDSKESAHSTPASATTMALPDFMEGVIVGDGNTTSIYMPVYTYYNNSLTQQIYTASELGVGAGMITKIAFNNTTGSYSYDRNIDVYMINTDKEYFVGNYDWVTVTSADKVYSGSHYFGAGWSEIDIDDFAYTGGNVLICFDDNTGSWKTSPSFKANNTSNARTLYVYNDNTNYDPSSPSNYYGYLLNQHNQIKFDWESAKPSVTVSPDPIALGEVRMGNYFSERTATSVEVTATAKNTTLGTITNGSSFFTMTTPSYNGANTEAAFTVGYDKTANDTGLQEGTITVTYEETETKEFTMTATAYTPVDGDVFEKATAVTFTDGTFSHTPTFANLHDDYIIPYEYNDGNNPDAVYTFTLTETSLVTANTDAGSWMAVYNSNFGGQGGPKADNSIETYLQNTMLEAGTYYLVVAVNGNFTLTVTAAELPKPTISYYNPQDGAMEQSDPVSFSWDMNYATEYQLLCGTTNPPTDVIVDWTNELAYYLQLEGFDKNTRYYWQVNARNEAGTTNGEVYSFVTPLDAPQNVTASATELYPDNNTTTISWSALESATLTGYNVYVNDVKQNAELLTATSMTLAELPYGLNPGNLVEVKAVHGDLGESPAASVYVEVAGLFPFTLTVTDGTDPIEGATVKLINGVDEFGVPIEEVTLTTNAEGVATATLPLLATNKYYDIIISKEYYETTPINALYISYYQVSNGETYDLSYALDMAKPTDVVASPAYIHVGESTTISWTGVEGDDVTYNVYVDGVKHNTEAVEGTSYTISGLAYNKNGYAVTVTAEHALGETPASYATQVYVGGTFTLTVNVTDGTNPIEGAEVTVKGDDWTYDEFGNLITAYEPVTTNADGVAVIENVKLLQSSMNGYSCYYITASYGIYNDGTASITNYSSIANGGSVTRDIALTLVTPANVATVEDYYMVGEGIELTWEAPELEDESALLGYNVYQMKNYGVDITKLNEEPLTETSYTITGLEYGSYNFGVSAVYDEGESSYQTTFVKVTGYSEITGFVKDDNEEPIKGVSITVEGYNEFDEEVTPPYTATTDESGAFSIENVMLSSWEGYTLTATKFDYQEKTVPGIEVVYGSPTQCNVTMQTLPGGTFAVTASEVGENVEVTWDVPTGGVAYNVYRRFDGDVTPLTTEEITTQSFTDETWSTLADGEYEYGVSAKIAQGLNITEDFEDGIPSTWAVYNKNGTVSNYDWKTTADHTGNGNQAAISNNNNWSNDNYFYMVTQLLDLTEVTNPRIIFDYYTPYYSSGYTHYTNTLRVKVLTEGQGQSAAVSAVQVWSNNAIYTTNWTNHTIDLSGYVGQKIYVVFESRPYEKYGRCTSIDNVQITSDATTYTTGVSWSEPVVKGGIEFLATATGNWNEGSNWSTGVVPASTDNVIIKGDAEITEDVNVNSINIAAGATLTLTSGTLNVTEGISNTVAEALVIEDGAQLFQNNNKLVATFNMDIVNPSPWTSHTEGWQFVSSPVKNAEFESFIPAEGDYDLFKYDGTQKLEWMNHKQHTQGGTEFSYNFDDQVIPDGFTQINNDGDTQSLNWHAELYGGNVHSGNQIYLYSSILGSAGCLYSESFANADNYLVLPKTSIIEGSCLKFKAASYYSHAYGGTSGTLEVYVSETDNSSVANFTKIETCDVSNGSDANTNIANALRDITIDLSAYAGKEIYIALRHNYPYPYNFASLVLVDDLQMVSGTFVPFDEEFVQGRGYLASYETETTATFAGTVNSANSFTFEEVNAYEAGSCANFYLLGNPFTFNMNWANVTLNNVYNGFATVGANGSYVYSNVSEVTEIPVGDGFFVMTTGSEPSMSYTHAASKGTRGVDANSINIIASGESGYDNVVIRLAGYETEGFTKIDNFNKEIAEVYVENFGNRYAIMSYDENTTEVEVSFHANEMGNYTIAAVPSGKFQTLTLVDRFTGIETNLLVEDYHFTATSSEDVNRFIVKLAVSDQQSAVSDNFVYQSGEELIVDAEGRVQIIDVMGRVVYSDDVESTNNRIDVSGFRNGTYMVRVINGSEVKVEKVVIY